MQYTIETSLLKAITPFQSKEQAGFYLNGVYFDNGLLVATDGHKLAAIKPFNAEGNITNFILPAETVKRILSVKAGKREVVKVTFTTGDTWQAKVFTGETILAIFPFQLVDGTFPDWRRVIPLEDNYTGNGVNSAKFNMAYLSSFASLAEHGRLYMHNVDEYSPCLFRAETSEYSALGVLMPMRDGLAIETIPSWLLEKKTATAKKRKTK